MKKLLTALAIGAFTFGYTQSAYYNDYRSSISGINWQTVAAELLLTPQQKQQLFALKKRMRKDTDHTPRQTSGKAPTSSMHSTSLPMPTRHMVL